MQTVITSQISRLSLHDSSFEEIVRDGANLDLTFDWSKLDNLKEENLTESIILGKTKMFFSGVHSEQFRIYDDNDGNRFYLQSFPEDYLDGDGEVIATNSIDDNAKTVTIGRLIKRNGVYHWTEWIFKFDKCEVSWTSFVTNAEWEKGKLPVD